MIHLVDSRFAPFIDLNRPTLPILMYTNTLLEMQPLSGLSLHGFGKFVETLPVSSEVILVLVLPFSPLWYKPTDVFANAFSMLYT